jgi:hypothetical protein
MKNFIIAVVLGASCAVAMAETYAFRVPVSVRATPSNDVNLAQLALSATSLQFGEALEKTQSLAKTVRVRNTGTSATSLSVQVTGEYSTASGTTCGESLAAGAQCTVAVTFTPRGAGRVKSGALTLISSSGAAVVALTGTSYLAASSVIVPRTLSLVGQRVGVIGSRTQAFLSVDVVGTAPVTFSQVSFSGPEAVGFASYVGAAGGGIKCTGVIAPGTTCVVTVAYVAQVLGTATRTAVINLPNTGTDRYGQAGPQTSIVKYDGNIVASAGLIYDGASPQAPYELGVGGGNIPISNAGNIDVHVSGVTISQTPQSGGAVQLSGMCDTLAPKVECRLLVTTTGFPVGVTDIIITINSDALNGPAHIYLRRNVSP